MVVQLTSEQEARLSEIAAQDGRRIEDLARDCRLRSGRRGPLSHLDAKRDSRRRARESSFAGRRQDRGWAGAEIERPNAWGPSSTAFRGAAVIL